MKEYIKAGIGVTIGLAIGKALIKIVSDAGQKYINKED